LYYTTLIFAI